MDAAFGEKAYDYSDEAAGDPLQDNAEIDEDEEYNQMAFREHQKREAENS